MKNVSQISPKYYKLYWRNLWVGTMITAGSPVFKRPHNKEWKRNKHDLKWDSKVEIKRCDIPFADLLLPCVSS